MLLLFSVLMAFALVRGGHGASIADVTCGSFEYWVSLASWLAGSLADVLNCERWSMTCVCIQLLVVAAIVFTLIFMFIVNSLLKHQQRLREAEGHFFAPGDFQMDDKFLFK